MPLEYPVCRGCGANLDQKVAGTGYHSGGVVPCCTDCNLAKNDNFTYEEFLVIGAAIRQVKLAREKKCD